ncbi:MAG: MFS transporter [Aestuariivirga sp.]|uniref:MFS transporter n=1 Tax=Aestuariivirga sp. TaxID=2650926 RepID=UPI0025B83678|nr:MFS transporter [Aestuariivirga sp.]MCA3559989.1 MFS transporter [Aestuariivirga sp.]
MPTAESSSRTGIIIAALATVGACDIAFGLTLQLIPLLMNERGWPAWAIGLNSAMGPIGILMAGPFLPRIIARAGTKRSVLVIIGVLVVSLAAISSLPVWMWFPLRFFFGLSTGALFVVSEAWILSAATSENRGRVMGIYTSLLSVTFATGPLILPWTGIQGFLPWGIGIVCILLAILPLAFVKVSDEQFQRHAGSSSFFGFVRRAPMLLYAIGAATLFDNVLIAFFTIYGIRNGLDLAVASRVLGIGIIGNVLLSYPLGWLADHWSRKAVMYLSAMLTVVLSLSLLAVIGHWSVWPVMMVLAPMAFATYVVGLATMGDTFKGPDLMAGTAAVATMWGVGGLIGPPVAGAAIDLFGIHAMPLTLAFFYVLLLAGLVVTGGKLVRRAPRG